MIFDRIHSVLGRTVVGCGVTVDLSAMRTRAPASLCGPGKSQGRSACVAMARTLPVFRLSEVAASGTCKNIVGMPSVFGNKMARKQGDLSATVAAILDLDP